jgi:hypothetical protein
MKHLRFLFFFALVLPVQGQTKSSLLPDKLTALRESYVRAMEKVSTPVRRTYLQELQKLKDEYVKAGNLQAALAVDEEIKTLNIQIPLPTTNQSSLIGPKLATVQIQGERLLIPLRVGEKLYSSTNYLWIQVPESLAGLKFAQSRDHHEGSTTLRVDSDGLVYMAFTSRWGIADDQPAKDGMVSRRELTRQGWKPLGSKHNLVSNEIGYEWLVFGRECKAGETFTLRTEKYCPPIVLTN